MGKEFPGLGEIHTSVILQGSLVMLTIAENCFIGHGAIVRGDYGKQLYVDLAREYPEKFVKL